MGIVPKGSAVQLTFYVVATIIIIIRRRRRQSGKMFERQRGHSTRIVVTPVEKS